MRTKGAITKRDEYFPVDTIKLKIFNIFFSKTIWLEKFNLSESIIKKCIFNHDPLDPWGPIRVSNLFIRMYMYIIIIIVAQVRDLVRGPFVYILSIGEFFLNQALFSVRLEMFIDFTLIIERKQLLDVD